VTREGVAVSPTAERSPRPPHGAGRSARLRPGLAAATAALALALGCAAPRGGAQPEPSESERRVAFYQRKLQDDPELYPALARLGGAYLERARESQDPLWLARAREALERSLRIQSSEYAYRTLARLCAFTHRFEEGLSWAQLAQANAPPRDPSLLPLLAELQIGLGRERGIAALLGSAPDPRGLQFFHAARAQWFTERSELAAAREAFLQTQSAAHAAGSSELALWAQVMAAGMLLDAGELGLARAQLALLARGPALPAWLGRVQRIHEAELAQAEGRLEAALQAYEQLLRETPDVELGRRAFLIARELGQSERAQALFAATERHAERIAAAGEVFALEAQARLYADAGVQAERARELARRNLEWKRDRAARELQARLQRPSGG
jgi:tetratricopeptide (TPR) repeat protein